MAAPTVNEGLRLEALREATKVAAGAAISSPDIVLEVATSYYAFLKGEK